MGAVLGSIRFFFCAKGKRQVGQNAFNVNVEGQGKVITGVKCPMTQGST